MGGGGEVGGKMQESFSGQHIPFSVLSYPDVGRYQRRGYWFSRESEQDNIWPD